MAFADLDSAKKYLSNLKSKAKSGPTIALEQEIKLFERIVESLNKGQAIRDLFLTDDEKKLIKTLNFLTGKPMMVVLNIDEAGATKQPVPQLNFNGPIIEISAKIEAELADLSPEEAKEFLSSIGQSQTGLDKLILAGYKLLDLITFLTSGPMESRAWTVGRGAKAPQAAGVIHSDFEKGFIRAEVCDYNDFISLGGWPKMKESGKMRLEGKDYEVRDGDVVFFHVNP